MILSPDAFSVVRSLDARPMAGWGVTLPPINGASLHKKRAAHTWEIEG